MNTERLIHNMPQYSTIDLSASSIWKTTESHHDRWVKLSCENTGMCLSYVPFTLVIRLINCWGFIQIWYDNKMLSSQWDNNNQHFVYIIVSWFLLGIITCQGFLFSCSCMNRCICIYWAAKNYVTLLQRYIIFKISDSMDLSLSRHYLMSAVFLHLESVTTNVTSPYDNNVAVHLRTWISNHISDKMW